MKRRIVKHGRNTMIISLPSSWIKKYGIGKGDEVEVNEKGSALEICTGEAVEFGRIEIDLSGLSPALICSAIKSAYINGFDHIDLSFQRPFADIQGKTVAVGKIASDVIKELVGVEITLQSNSGCTIKEVSSSSLKEFDSVVRRAFLLLADALANAAGGDFSATENAQDECLNAQKLVNYCLRCISRHGYPHFKKSYSLFHILATANIISAELLKCMDAVHQLNEYDRIAFGQLSGAIHNFSASLFRLQHESLAEIENACNSVIAAKKVHDEMAEAAPRIVHLLWDMTQYRLGMQ